MRGLGTETAIDASRNVTYYFTDELNGAVNDTISLSDHVGCAVASAHQTFTLASTAVNDTPTFTVGANQSVLEDAGTQTVNGFIAAFSQGPANESTQTLTFNTSILPADAAAFATAPAIDASGNLTYTFADDFNGAVTVTVSLSDNGGGADTSATQTFTLTATAVNDTPAIYCRS